MLLIGILFFILTAVFGSILLIAVLNNKTRPKSVALLHGSGAFIGLLVLISFLVAGHLDKLFLTGFILLVLAALGGLTLFSLDMLQKKPPPKLVVLLHPVLALSGLLCLVISYLHMPHSV